MMLRMQFVVLVRHSTRNMCPQRQETGESEEGKKKVVIEKNVCFHAPTSRLSAHGRSEENFLSLRPRLTLVLFFPAGIEIGKK